MGMIIQIKRRPLVWTMYLIECNPNNYRAIFALKIGMVVLWTATKRNGECIFYLPVVIFTFSVWNDFSFPLFTFAYDLIWCEVVNFTCSGVIITLIQLANARSSSTHRNWWVPEHIDHTLCWIIYAIHFPWIPCMRVFWHEISMFNDKTRQVMFKPPTH